MAEITNRLTLENVLEDQFRSPLSLRDFRVYLTYEEYSVENLDFYEWYENYKKTFDSLNYSIKSLSSAPEKKYHSFDPTLVYVNPDGDPLPKLDQPPIYPSQYTELQPLQIPPIAHPATKSLRPTSIQNQPLRAEIDQILATYILPGSPNELNLTSGTRAYVTEQARLTTHPQAFQPAIVEVLDIMHAQSFVNFRHLIAETNLDKVHWFKVVFWLCGPLTLGLIIVLVLLLLDQSRWWRLCALPLIWLGLINVLSFTSKLCILRLGYGVRDLRSYEIRALKAQGQTPQSKKVKIAEKLVLRFQRQVWKWRLYCTILVALIFNFALCALPENMIARQ